MGLFRPYQPTNQSGVTEPSRDQARPAARGAGKGVPTPSRKEAEAARRQRLNPVLTKKELRARERQTRAAQRNRAMTALEAQPERVLLRDYVDSRWTLTEFLLPVMVLVLALSFLASRFPVLLLVSTVAAYGLLLAAVVDLARLWRGYKRVLADRLPRVSSKGLLVVMINRAMSIRRFRVPAPRITRGDEY